jgi:signal transduction histidine kinase
LISPPQSLKAQVVIAIALLTGLFAASAFYSMHVIDQQHSDDTLLQLATRLQYGQQQLAVQAMRYRDNAPRDYPSYYRDLRLYFVDLQRTRAELDEIIGAFEHDHFGRRLVGEDMAMQPHLPPASRAIVAQLAGVWRNFTLGLDERIGDDTAAPRLEWAAEWISERGHELEQEITRLLDTLQAEVARRAALANRVNRLLLALALLVALGTGLWFYWRVIDPLATAVKGFRVVANGDFAHQVPVSNDDEIGALATTFNQLSARLDALRRLLTRLEQGGDLAATLRTLSETLPNLLPVDWIAVLMVTADGRIQLQQAFSDGSPDPLGQLSFENEGTLLAECIDTHQPLHIADVAATSGLSERFVFLRQLLALGRRDALFLPVNASGGIKGVAVFASRYPNSYQTEHLELLRNIGVLLGVSLGRTIQLAESKRLATIGQFASGIVHEIRNPLATISLALEHLRGLDTLPPGTGRRVTLASEEVARLERLLSDILLYAKPLALTREPHAVGVLLHEVLDAEPTARARVDLLLDDCPAVSFDRDRLRQVLINLLRNALQAAPDDEKVSIACRMVAADALEIRIHNGGEPISERLLPRLFEPFVTSRQDGTGLGLAISARIIAAHGGNLSIDSTREAGTTVTVRLPHQGGARSAAQAAEAD